ncbi:MAG: MarR family winged helix-turn-helix transcriptional regulator [Rhodobacteraceae bacterium]|nr:MarR family winged helix-turn-helix transcriptional regulator [Paracoccaceae bacterium]
MTEGTPIDAQPENIDVFSVMNEIGIIQQLGSTAFERVMPDDMTLAQFTVLNHFVRLGGPRRLVDLARSFQVTKGAMTNTVGKLSAKGLVTVADDMADKRAKLVDITAAGRAMRDECVACLRPGLEALSTALPPEAWAAALPLLQQVRRWLDENRDWRT